MYGKQLRRLASSKLFLERTKKNSYISTAEALKIRPSKKPICDFLRASFSIASAARLVDSVFEKCLKLCGLASSLHFRGYKAQVLEARLSFIPEQMIYKRRNQVIEVQNKLRDVFLFPVCIRFKGE